MQQTTRAYVLVQTDRGTRGIAELVRGVPGVQFAEDISGPYDALALAGPSGGDLGLEAILSRVRALPGVIRALPAPLAAHSVELPPVSAEVATADAA